MSQLLLTFYHQDIPKHHMWASHCYMPQDSLNSPPLWRYMTAHGRVRRVGSKKWHGLHSCVGSGPNRRDGGAERTQEDRKAGFST